LVNSLILFFIKLKLENLNINKEAGKMPNGLPHDKEYGPHEYPEAPHRTSDCKYGCGCSAGPTMSHGPLGLNPFGECPQNPKDGVLLGGDDDYRCVVERRIRHLEKKASERDHFEKLAGTEKVEIDRQLDEARTKFANIRNAFNHFKERMSEILDEPKETTKETTEEPT